jgi:hypothetical protein
MMPKQHVQESTNHPHAGTHAAGKHSWDINHRSLQQRKICSHRSIKCQTISSMQGVLTDMRWNMLLAPPGRLQAQMPLMAATYVNVIMRPPTSAGFLQGHQQQQQPPDGHEQHVAVFSIDHGRHDAPVVENITASSNPSATQQAALSTKRCTHHEYLDMASWLAIRYR